MAKYIILFSCDALNSKFDSSHQLSPLFSFFYLALCFFIWFSPFSLIRPFPPIRPFSPIRPLIR